LYDRSWAPQCSPIYIQAMGGSSPPAKTAPTASVSQMTDGQILATTAVSQISDGQVIATTGLYTASVSPVSQISDGQVQNPGSAKATMSTMPSMVHVSQMTDGQVIASPVSQAPVSQMSDGQIVATPPPATVTTSRAAISEKTDGQPVVPATTAAASKAVSSASVASPSAAKPSQVTVNAAAPAGNVLMGTGAMALVAVVFGAIL
jgi:hypothetical protein